MTDLDAFVHFLKGFCGEQKRTEVGPFVPLLLLQQQRQLQPKVFKQSQHSPVRRCFVISHRMRKRYDFQKRWRRYKQGLWIPRASGDLLASNPGEALIVLWETKSSFFFSLWGGGWLPFIVRRQPYKTRVAWKKERQKKPFITAREVWIPFSCLLCSLFCTLWCRIKWLSGREIANAWQHLESR